jgi:uncharacterized protein (TIGR00255 family)
MQSMTAYSSIENSTEQFSYSVGIKSLNSRYLEIFVNLHKILKDEENDFIQILKNNFNRGKIELSIDIFDWVTQRSISINTDLLRKYFDELNVIRSGLCADNPLSFDALLGLDGVINRERTLISEKSRNDIYKTLNMAIKKTIEMRKKEGDAIRVDVEKSLSEITNYSGEIKGLLKDISKVLFQKLKQRLEDLVKSSIDDVRLFTEVAILTDKLDINEELIRLNDHIRKFKACMKEKDQIGKKLDFIAQEMFREINTISSKSNSSQTAHIVVEVKNHIEKIREHCRNVV